MSLSWGVLSQLTVVSKKIKSNEVFIVHGHDETPKLAVARFIEKLGNKAIILHEQANEGMTTIKKFKKYAKNAVFAIVITTPADMGHANMLNNAARSVIESVCGNHPDFVFTYLGKPITRM